MGYGGYTPYGQGIGSVDTKTRTQDFLEEVATTAPSVEDQLELIRAQTRLAMERKQEFEAMERAYSVRLELEKRRDRKWNRRAKHKTELAELETRLAQTEKERDVEATERHMAEARVNETLKRVLDAVDRVAPGLAQNADAAMVREATEVFLREEPSLVCSRCHHTPQLVYLDSIQHCATCGHREGDPIPDDIF